jgi:tetratricopeptide (TPR) repeat protein
MPQSPFSRPSGRARQNGIGRLLGTALILIVVAACSSKSQAQQATDELNAGLQAASAGNTDAAVQHYQACLTHDNQNKFCIYNLGVNAQRLNQLLQAENDYRLALLIDPNFPSALFNLATIRAADGGQDEAIALYQHYVALTPNDAGAHVNLGILLASKGDQTGAAAEFATALKLDPSTVIPSLAPASPSPTPSAGPKLSPSPNASPRPSPSPS